MAAQARQFLGVAIASGILVSSILLVPLSQTAMRESPEMAASYLPKTTIKRKRLVIDLAAFKKDGIVVVDNALSIEELRSARADVAIMMEANIYFEKTEQDSEDVRTDCVCWISERIPSQRVTLGAGLREALRIVRSAPLALMEADETRGQNTDTDTNMDLLMGVPLSNQLASYSHGGKYVAHRDTPGVSDASFHHPLQRLLQPGLNDRKLTVILYLNDTEWDEGKDDVTDESKHEGCLRCYLGTNKNDGTGSSASRVLNIAPKGGRMVIFDSTKVLHEVCSFPDTAPTRQRTAITCWVGGTHSEYTFLRPFCIPREEMLYCLWPSRIKPDKPSIPPTLQPSHTST